jgi:hypothetical protein
MDFSWVTTPERVLIQQVNGIDVVVVSGSEIKHLGTLS